VIELFSVFIILQCGPYWRTDIR